MADSDRIDRRNIGKKKSVVIRVSPKEKEIINEVRNNLEHNLKDRYEKQLNELRTDIYDDLRHILAKYKLELLEISYEKYKLYRLFERFYNEMF